RRYCGRRCLSGPPRRAHGHGAESDRRWRHGNELSEKHMKSQYEHFIGGSWREPVRGEYFERISPVTEQPLTTIARGSARDIDIAVQDAHHAYPAWRALGPAKRAEIMRAVAQGMRA